jgi:hypothetical protein
VSPPAALSERQLNRATLARQHLLERAGMPPYDMVEHLVGLQAQTPKSWYLTLWSRLAPLNPEGVAALLADRRLVRGWFMRQTIHLVTDRDAPLLRAFTQGVSERSVRGRWLAALAGVDLGELRRVMHRFTAETPRTHAELLAETTARWPQATDHVTVTNAVKALVPMVQVPPRGLWGRSGAVRMTPLDTWLGTAVPTRVDPRPIVRRYLAAYGPASVADAQLWSGVTRLGETFERLRPELVTFRDARGRELFDLPDAPRPDPDLPAPVRFLADFDNVLLAHADRSRFVDEATRDRLAYRTGPYPSALLVGGRLAGAWYASESGTTVEARIDTARRLDADEEAAVRAEAERMLRFNHPRATERRVEVRSLDAGLSDPRSPR